MGRRGPGELGKTHWVTLDESRSRARRRSSAKRRGPNRPDSARLEESLVVRARVPLGKFKAQRTGD